eukprot:358486-Chlamydomonas_euryale.AAC.4
MAGAQRSSQAWQQSSARMRRAASYNAAAKQGWEECRFHAMQRQSKSEIMSNFKLLGVRKEWIILISMGQADLCSR